MRSRSLRRLLACWLLCVLRTTRHLPTKLLPPHLNSERPPWSRASLPCTSDTRGHISPRVWGFSVTLGFLRASGKTPTPDLRSSCCYPEHWDLRATQSRLRSRSRVVEYFSLMLLRYNFLLFLGQV